MRREVRGTALHPLAATPHRPPLTLCLHGTADLTSSMQDVASAAHTTSTELEAEVLRREQLQERVQELEVMPRDLHTRRHTQTHTHRHARTYARSDSIVACTDTTWPLWRNAHTSLRMHSLKRGRMWLPSHHSKTRQRGRQMRAELRLRMPL